MTARRSTLGRTTRAVLQHLVDHGVCGLNHGSRWALFNGASWIVKSDCEHFLRTSGMIEAAGGNYPDHYVRITDYGRDCLKRGSKDLGVSVPFFWGPQADQVTKVGTPLEDR